MHYFGSIECDSCNEIKILIDTCMGVHNNDRDNHYVDENIYSYNLIFRYFSSSIHQKFTSATNAKVLKNEPDYAKLRAYFSWLTIYIIKKTFENTTQYGRTPAFAILKSNYKSPFLALNTHHRHELVFTDVEH